MRCPFCGHDEDRVIDSRPSEEGAAIRRRRECIACGNRFTTYEKVETLPLLVVKKDGARQSFDRAKLFSGIMKACEKRPVTTEQIEKLVDSIESSAQNSLKRELSSREIGEMVMNGLKQIDEVAYVRFASVYRQFRDVNSFMKELNDIMLGKKAENRESDEKP
ncbi:MAG: transcriptional repressor NrdR [Clostridiaceae bacterium]|jgi:transcriptional repressor NrdR|nr:transcriptional repressor NrdR [Clostridiaceae bacterium]